MNVKYPHTQSHSHIMALARVQRPRPSGMTVFDTVIIRDNSIQPNFLCVLLHHIVTELLLFTHTRRRRQTRANHSAQTMVPLGKINETALDKPFPPPIPATAAVDKLIFELLNFMRPPQHGRYARSSSGISAIMP